MVVAGNVIHLLNDPYTEPFPALWQYYIRTKIEPLPVSREGLAINPSLKLSRCCNL